MMTAEQLDTGAGGRDAKNYQKARRQNGRKRRRSDWTAYCNTGK
jgi:hypothetical protein